MPDTNGNSQNMIAPLGVQLEFAPIPSRPGLRAAQISFTAALAAVMACVNLFNRPAYTDFMRILRISSLIIIAATASFGGVAAYAQVPPATAVPQQLTQSQKLPDATAQEIARMEGQPVAEVRVISELGSLISQNPADLPTLAGHPFDSDAVRESVRKLFASGRFADLRAEVAIVQGGIRVDFVVVLNLFIGIVRIEGLAEPPNESTAFAALRLTVGQPFREGELQEGLVRLKDALTQDGLYQAQINVERLPDPATLQMNLNIKITAGHRAKTGAISVKNVTPLTDTELLSRAKLKSGKTFDSRDLKRAEDRLRAYLIKQDYLGSRAAIHRGTFEASTNTVPMTLDVVAGLRVRVEVTGAKIPPKELRKRVPVFEEGAVDPDLLLEGRRALRDFFERQGYFEAAVSYDLTEAEPKDKKAGGPKEQLITYKIERGPRERLAGVSFEGQHYFSSGILRSRLGIHPATFSSPGRFSQLLLEDDTVSLQELYRANGFQQAKITSQIDKNYQGKQNELFVHLRVEEGTQTMVGKLTLEGNKALTREQLLDVIGSSPGQPYSEFNVSTDRDNVLALYYNEGFQDAVFKSKVEDLQPSGTAGERQRVAITITVEEGQQVRTKQVLIGGYERTRRGVIAREIQVKPGEPLREGEVIETQGRLYNLGIFSRVTLAQQNPDGTDQEKTLTVIVEEAKRYTVAYGGGIEVQRLGGAGAAAVSGSFQASPRLTFEVSKANFSGRGDTLSFKVRASTLQGRALLSYTAVNYFGNPNFSLQATIFADKSRDITTFTSTRYESSLQLAERFSRTTTVLYRYSFRKVLVDAASLQIAPQQIPLFSQPTLVSEFGISWLRDHRDNPADATRGNFNTVDFSLAGKPIGSSASFARLFLQNSSFYRIGSGLVIARSVRFGLQQTLPDTISSEIPLPERFFAGGGSSLRGFGLNQAGPRDPVTGFPVGGQALLLFNQELRFPLRLPRVGTKLGGALFYDAGNVFSRLGTITFRTTPTAASQSSGELSYFSHTVGIGFRYATPIGPVRVDLAYQLNAAQFFIPCTIGNPGCGINGMQLTRLPRFQFFFNLGDVF
jgi:outer membrane protein insertion porin family